MPPETEAAVPLETVAASAAAADASPSDRATSSKSGPMGWVRLLWRLPAVTGWTLAIYLTYVTGRGLTMRRPAARRNWRNRIVANWSRGLGRILGMQLEVEGTPPSDGALLVANHLSYLDIIVLGGHAGARFVAKSEIASWPVFGHLSKVADVIFVNRSSRRDLLRVGDAVRGALEGGDSVIVFPEGTSTRGERVTRFKPSLLDYPARAGMPVHYACLTYRAPAGSPPADEVLCWWGDMELVGHLLELLRVPRFKAWLTFGETPIGDTDRKKLAGRLEEAVARRFTPVVDSVEGA